MLMARRALLKDDFFFVVGEPCRACDLPAGCVAFVSRSRQPRDGDVVCVRHGGGTYAALFHSHDAGKVCLSDDEGFHVLQSEEVEILGVIHSRWQMVEGWLGAGAPDALTWDDTILG